MFKHSGLNIKYNVGIRRVDVTNGKVTEEFGNNRVMRNFLIGLLKFAKGDFRVGIGEATQYIPYTLHVGSSNATVTIDDIDLVEPIYVKTYTALLVQPDDWATNYGNYYTYNSVTEVYAPCTNTTPFVAGAIYEITNTRLFETGLSESIPDTDILGQDYVTITYKFMIDTNALIGETISEIGLFTKADSENKSYMMARYVLETPIIKTNTEFIQIVWMISFRSYHPEPEE